MIVRQHEPLVHGAWTAAWWAGDPGLAEAFGPPPSLAALDDRADALPIPTGWTACLAETDGGPPPDDALVVLAGQQPVLGGGALLVAHKAATAVALARILAARWERPVVPVFLLATQDHDSTEVDHLDLIDPRSGQLSRLRCPLLPKHEMFSRCHWDPEGFRTFERKIRELYSSLNGLNWESTPETPAADHVTRLLQRLFGPLGLHVVEAHRLERSATPVLGRALAASEEQRGVLARGADRLRAAELHVSFEADDPRPLVLESSSGRRRRLAPDDAEATARLARAPDDFSPHAALRPIVQAAALPVVAQVCGPSELLYLGQARGLHALYDLPAPILVPRLEATRVEPDQLAAVADGDPSAGYPIRASGSNPEADALEAALQALDAAAVDFAERLQQVDSGLRSRLDRFVQRTRRDARRLAEAPAWHGRDRGDAWLRPRGRPQDTVLAWLPEAWRAGDPADWGRHLVELCRPLDPPVHVLHTYPETD